MTMHNYPLNWIKASKTLRRAVRRCELCCLHYPVKKLSVHHVGKPYADGRPGDPHDKHDLRRENLMVLCPWCHAFLDNMPSQQSEPVRIKRLAQRQRQQANKQTRKQATIDAHRLLGVGTGLVAYQKEIN